MTNQIKAGKAYSQAQGKCRRHAATCRACYQPIIDPEGNPGLIGEACAIGARLLRAYIAAEDKYFKEQS